ncbi:hypothetical protein [Prevotella sp. E2-28]|uniref:HU family DNA-binding protein n=1 Tax=Prevotella sp. E2-28 TaxID=2913620 RepID=UPI001EDB8CA0|nr:hypothetical protein [Prevotella sp. E2-28]UKK53434.1 hypothetical protein L6465_12745 [Prevotella sp. E2-28]
MKIGNTIHYAVHPTPLKLGETVQTYHVRQVLKTTMRTRELAEHVSQHSPISVGLFEMVLDELKRELVEQLVSGHDLHLDGIGRFSLRLGTKKKKGEDGRWHTKTYLQPDELTAREVEVEGITFVPDKEMLSQLNKDSHVFTREKEGYEQDVPRAKLLKTLADYCQAHGSFTRSTFQGLFGVSRYRAQQMLDALVAEPFPKYYREKYGPSYIYRKTGT